MLTKEPSYSDIEVSSDLGAMISKTKPWSNDENRYIEFFQNVLALAQTE